MGKEKSLDDELALRLKAIRERHGIPQRTVAKCMEIGVDTLRHKEKGRRPVPDFMDGRIAWVRKFLECIGATPEEEEEVLVLASRSFVGQFSDWMLDIENRKRRKPRP